MILQPLIIAQFFPLLAHCVVRYIYYIVYTTKYASPELVHMLYIPKVFIFFFKYIYIHTIYWIWCMIIFSREMGTTCWKTWVVRCSNNATPLTILSFDRWPLCFHLNLSKKEEEKLEEKRSGTKNLLRREAISAAVFKLYDA